MSKEANNFRNYSRRRFIKLASTGAVALTAGSVILAACGDNTPTQAVATSAAGTTVATSASSATTATTAATGVTTAAASNLAPAEVTLTYRALPQRDTQAVQDALNELLKTKQPGTTIKLNPIDPSAYEQKIKLSFAANEKLDLLFTASWTNNFWTNVAQGNLLPLDDLLNKYAPKLFASMPQQVWSGVKVSGKYYAVPNQSFFLQPWGAQIRKDLADKYKLDVASLKKFEDLEPFMDQIKANESGVTPIYSDDQTGGFVFRPAHAGYDAIVDLAGVVIKGDDPELKVFNEYGSPEFKHFAELASKWYKAGYYTKDPLPPADANAAQLAGKYALALHQTGPDVAASLKARFNQDYVVASFSPPVYLTSTSIASNLLAISRTSAHPERAMMLLELLNSDIETFNLLAKGIENKHWVWVDKPKKVIGQPPGLTPQTNPYFPNTDYLFGNAFNGYYINPGLVGVWDKEAQLNKDGTPSQALGFAADLTKLNTESAQVNAVIKQFGYPMMKGQLDPATGLTEFLSRLKSAGQDKVIEEVQNQINAWKKAK
jgi:putative aldouronate transport system substrate-binding protein